MARSLPVIPLPLPPNGPPDQFGWEERDMSAISTRSACEMEIDLRDKFLGRRRCTICGLDCAVLLDHCHIIMRSELKLWTELKDRNWIPDQSKAHPGHEPRDGILMCQHHHTFFDKYRFYIRYDPEVNHSNQPQLQQFHGKAIALDVQHRYAPFPSLFIIHEMRVRGFNPFEPVSPEVPVGGPWQDWISSGGVFDDESNSFRRDMPARGGDENSSGPPPLQRESTIPAIPSGARALGLDANTIAEILAATRSMNSWKACVMEGTSWDGTAEENIQKYTSTIGIDHQS